MFPPFQLTCDISKHRFQRRRCSLPNTLYFRKSWTHVSPPGPQRSANGTATAVVSGQDTIGLHSRRGEDALVHPRFPYHDCTEGRRVEREWRTQEDRYKELTFEDYILSREPPDDGTGDY